MSDTAQNHTADQSAEKELSQAPGIGGYISFIIAILFFSGLLITDKWWGIFDYTILNGSFGNVVANVADKGGEISTTFSNFRGKGGSGAIDGFMFALTLVPSIMLATAMIAVCARALPPRGASPPWWGACASAGRGSPRSFCANRRARIISTRKRCRPRSDGVAREESPCPATTIATATTSSPPSGSTVRAPAAPATGAARALSARRPPRRIGPRTPPTRCPGAPRWTPRAPST